MSRGMQILLKSKEGMRAKKQKVDAKETAKRQEEAGKCREEEETKHLEEEEAERSDERRRQPSNKRRRQLKGIMSYAKNFKETGHLGQQE